MKEHKVDKNTIYKQIQAIYRSKEEIDTITEYRKITGQSLGRFAVLSMLEKLKKEEIKTQ